MTLFELFITAIGLAMDAFAVAMCQGFRTNQSGWKPMLMVGAFFGGFQAMMPLLGYLLGVQFADHIQMYDHWIAFALLGLIGLNMVRESRSEPDCASQIQAEQDPTGAQSQLLVDPGGEATAVSARALFPLAIATSIDALAIGVSFAFLQVSIGPAVSFIGIVTFVLSAAGLYLGNLFGARFEKKAELTGGLVLIFMGLKILLQHTLLAG